MSLKKKYEKAFQERLELKKKQLEKIELSIKSDVDSMVKEAKSLGGERDKFVSELRKDLSNVKKILTDAKQLARNGSSRSDDPAHEKKARALNDDVDKLAGIIQKQAEELGLDPAKSDLWKELKKAADITNPIAAGDDEELQDIAEYFEYLYAEINNIK